MRVARVAEGAAEGLAEVGVEDDVDDELGGEAGDVEAAGEEGDTPEDGAVADRRRVAAGHHLAGSEGWLNDWLVGWKMGG